MTCHPLAVRPGTGCSSLAHNDGDVGVVAHSSAKDDELMGGGRREIVRNKLREAVRADYGNFDHRAIPPLQMEVSIANSSMKAL